MADDRITIDTLGGLSFNSLRRANLARLPQFKNAKGGPAHSEPDGLARTLKPKPFFLGDAP